VLFGNRKLLFFFFVRQYCKLGKEYSMYAAGRRTGGTLLDTADRKVISMTRIETDLGGRAISSWRELWRKEDYWAIWLGLGIVLVAYALFASGSSIKWLAVTPAKWSTLSQLGGHFADNAQRYVAQFIVWLAIFSVALTALGHKARDFIPAFAFLYLFSVAIFALGQWDQASR